MPPPWPNAKLAAILDDVDLGTPVAEVDQLLDQARVETSVFADLVRGRVDLIPGTKGSGKTALFRLVVEYLPDALLKQRRVVVAHGVEDKTSVLWDKYRSEFAAFSEEQFLDFWCLYLISLARDIFLRDERYRQHLTPARQHISEFDEACERAGIPDFDAPGSLARALDWCIGMVRKIWPTKVSIPIDEKGTQATFEWSGSAGGSAADKEGDDEPRLPPRIQAVAEALEKVLDASDLSLWLMVDRLDELFLRRSETERLALRALLRAKRYFASPRLSLKIFLRDDILGDITTDGFSALTHVTARQADPLRWTQEQILTLVVNRLYANVALRTLVDVDMERLKASADYREEAFYKVFPSQVFAGERQSMTLSWLYKRTMDGNGVVTPRDVIFLLTKATQAQRTRCRSSSGDSSDAIVTRHALEHGLEQLSEWKYTTYLKAEFPHFAQYIESFRNGKSKYLAASLYKLIGAKNDVVQDLVGVGFLRQIRHLNQDAWEIPHLYRAGLGIKQGLG